MDVVRINGSGKKRCVWRKKMNSERGYKHIKRKIK